MELLIPVIIGISRLVRKTELCAQFIQKYSKEDRALPSDTELDIPTPTPTFTHSTCTPDSLDHPKDS